jgi:hypothetical protein
VQRVRRHQLRTPQEALRQLQVLQALQRLRLGWPQPKLLKPLQALLLQAHKQALLQPKQLNRLLRLLLQALHGLLLKQLETKPWLHSTILMTVTWVRKLLIRLWTTMAIHW